ncbi:hypothetical protein JCM10914A_48270 [Paenibacillus sp. JCM 10914]|uniref:SMI1/KNR4 family protein n=1 Tax=Paenibacillus sp. JCM 10914 TaxID=1236974 RepID=UPI0003CC5141|nr:SMI1/KNR4 family protein [Paenibacillus sp. JCM 10914]GAE06493.1 hypothetical protein JCM10914_2656 [Paenibacillus sp. JCM 10914]
MYESLAKKLESTTAVKWFPGRGAKEEWIVEAEAELGFNLPPSYRWWLKNYGIALLSGTGILKLGPSETRDIDDMDILYIHRLNQEDEEWRAMYPHRLDLFVPDEDELYYFDTSSSNEQGEFTVIRYDLMNGIVEEYAPSFAEFLEQLIDRRSSVY